MKVYIPKKGKVKNLALDARKYLKEKKIKRTYRKKVRQQKRLEKRNEEKVVPISEEKFDDGLW
jgi:hypothetical protein